MLKFFLIGIMGIAMEGCTSFSDSQIVMNTSTERKQKPEYMPHEERPIENHPEEEKKIPIAPQLGIRIPLGK